MTGSPSVGKTTVLTRTIEALVERGFRVGGMISREVGGNGARVGFEIIDIESSKRGWLAQVNQGSGPIVGRYRVNVKDLEEVGVESIKQAIQNCDVGVIDEIGPMELFSEKFVDAASRALQSQKLVLAVVHWKATDRLVVDAKTMDDAEVFLVTLENRGKIAGIVVSKALNYLKRR